MEIAKNRSVLQIDEGRKETYEWKFDIPPKSRILSYLHKSKQSIDFKNLTFNTGTLASIDHKFNLKLLQYESDILIHVCLELPQHTLTNEMVKVSSVHFDKMNSIGCKSTGYASLDHFVCKSDAKVLWSARIYNSEYTWDDTVNAIVIQLTIKCKKFEPIISKCEKFPPLNNTINCNNFVASSEFYLSEDLSDVVFSCQGDEFPSHRFVLTCMSPVFKRMFQHNLRETKEGRIEIEDMRPSVLKEMLRFMYCGKVENMEGVCEELFVAADKYDLQVLKDRCEEKMLGKLNTENAVKMFSLAKYHGARVLQEAATSVARQNKTVVVPDSQTLDRLCKDNPADVMFDLFFKN